MSGLGGLNKTPNGVVLGMVQLQLPTVVTPTDLAEQTERIVAMVAKARRNMPSLDLVVFPEYSLHGLSMDINAEIMCRLDGPEVAAFRQACIDNYIWGCFSIDEVVQTDGTSCGFPAPDRPYQGEELPTLPSLDPVPSP